MPSPYYSPEFMSLVNRRMQNVPAFRGAVTDADTLWSNWSQFSQQQRDRFVSAMVLGRPSGYSEAKFNAVAQKFAEALLGNHDAQCKKRGMTREQYAEGVAAANGIRDPELLNHMHALAPQLAGHYVAGRMNAREQAHDQKHGQPKPELTALEKQRRAAAEDRDSRRALIASQVEHGAPEGKRRDIYDPADHDKPGSQGRRADIARAMAQSGFRDRYGVEMESGLLPSEVVETAIESDNLQAENDAQWNSAD